MIEDPSDSADHPLDHDRISITNLSGVTPGSTHTTIFHHADGTESRTELRHSMNEEQIDWFRAGSALNLLRASGGSEVGAGS